MTTLFKHTAFVFFSFILSVDVIAQTKTTIDLEKYKSEKNKDIK